MSLGEGFAVRPEAEQAPSSEVAGHRRRPRTDQAERGEPLPFFDETRVPVETIELSVPEVEGLDESEFEVIGHKECYRLAQRPGSYVVLKYRRPVVKLKGGETIHCPAAPESVIRASRADVSFIAGLLIDKLLYHLPLYRQHQRLLDAGFTLSRPWLTQLVHAAAFGKTGSRTRPRSRAGASTPSRWCARSSPGSTSSSSSRTCCPAHR